MRRYRNPLSRSCSVARVGFQGRLRIEALEPRLVLDGTVGFNEIMYHPSGHVDDTLEWVELHNPMAIDLDLSRWSLEGGIQFEFAEGAEIAGRGYLVIAADPTVLESETGINGVLGSLHR